MNSIHNNRVHYPIKKFTESYSHIKYVYLNPAKISHFASDPGEMANAAKAVTEKPNLNEAKPNQQGNKPLNMSTAVKDPGPKEKEKR